MKPEINQISIIVPVYNVAQFLPKTLDSILAQTYSNIEVILVDDGSSDETGDICDQYSAMDNRIRVIHKSNAGVSAARNDGLLVATGDYIGFIDGDDLIEKDMFEILLRNAEEYGADISICNMDTVDVDGRQETVYEYATKSIDAEEIVKGYFFDPSIKSIMYSQCNKIFSRNVLSGIWFKPYRYCEDILFVFEAVLNCEKIYYDNRIGYHYIHRKDSAMTSAFAEKRLDYVFAARELAEACVSQYPQYGHLAERWVYYHTLVTMRQIITSGQKDKFHDFYFENKEYLRQKRGYLKKLGFKRILDYWGIMYCHWYIKLLNYLKGRI